MRAGFPGPQERRENPAGERSLLQELGRRSGAVFLPLNPPLSMRDNLSGEVLRVSRRDRISLMQIRNVSRVSDRWYCQSLTRVIHVWAGFVYETASFQTLI